MSNSEFDLSSVSEEDLRAVQSAIEDLSNQTTKVELIKESIKEAKKALVESYDWLEPKTLTWLFNRYHRQDLDTVVSDINTLDDLYRGIFKTEV